MPPRPPIEWTRWSLAAAASTAIVVVTGVGREIMRYQAHSNDPIVQDRKKKGTEYMTSNERIDRFNKIARMYDQEVSLDEIVTGILFRRSKLLRHATGDVLEIGVGTGRNFTYYEPTQVKHLTAIDASSGMLDVAKKRAEHYGKKQAKGDALDLAQTQFVLQEAEALPFESGKFDTVVDTFGLCSYEDPAKVMKEIERVLRPGGKALFLEHGRSPTHDWINLHLDGSLFKHLLKFGCYWNRDIPKIISQSNLIVEEQDMYHFGTGYFMVTKKPEIVDKTL